MSNSSQMSNNSTTLKLTTTKRCNVVFAQLIFTLSEKSLNAFVVYFLSTLRCMTALFMPFKSTTENLSTTYTIVEQLL
jgi:hypothetical protein